MPAYDGKDNQHSKRGAFMVKRIFIILTLIFLFVSCASVRICAEDEFRAADEYISMLDQLPDEIRDLLPDKLFSSNVSDIENGAEEAISFGYIIEVIVNQLGLEIKGVLKLFVSILGLLVLSSLMSSVKTSFSSDGIQSSFSVVTSCAVFLTAFACEYTVVKAVSVFFERLCLFVNSFLPLSTALYAMGGNVASAVVHHSSLMIFITLVENFCAHSALPITGICLSLTTVGAFVQDINVGAISKFFKKTYTQLLSLLMTVFVTVMGAQSLLAGKSDTLAGKAAKFAVSNLIPTVGTALAGTLGTVAASIEYIRASVGIVGIVIVILLLVPTLVTLILTRLAFSLLGCISDVLGCTNEKKILDEISGVNGFLLALTAISSVGLIFIMTIFAKCSSAAGGGLL